MNLKTTRELSIDGIRAQEQMWREASEGKSGRLAGFQLSVVDNVIGIYRGITHVAEAAFKGSANIILCHKSEAKFGRGVAQLLSVPFLTFNLLLKPARLLIHPFLEGAACLFGKNYAKNCADQYKKLVDSYDAGEGVPNAFTRRVQEIIKHHEASQARR